MSVVIKIENLSKQYRLGLVGTGTLSHDLRRWWHLVRGKEDPYLKIGDVNDRSTKGSSDYIWALKDINFEVRQGEILGIIGKNGAGKSTLLKIFSRITAPTTGTIEYKGRIGSLLEVGTGFHLELTGRENIFVNGAVLGMRKSEILRKFDAIVDFSGCERYIDTPVKRYSSGMTVRLGFAVAAFLEPEILVIDEVLAVGDAEFQKKALGKMQEVSTKDGRTVLFVSHNMSAIQNLCSQVILINNGKIILIGDKDTTVEEYLKTNHDTRILDMDFSTRNRQGVGNILFKKVSFMNKLIKLGADLQISIYVANNVDQIFRGIKLEIGIDNNMGIRVAHLSSRTLNKEIQLGSKEECEILLKIEELPLVSGQYSITLYCEADGQIQDWIKNAVYFNIENSDFYLTGKLPPLGQGNILLKYKMQRL